MSDLNEIKAKFSTLEEDVTKLNNKKIGLASEIKTIEEDIEVLTQSILEKTGKATLDEAIQYFNEQKSLLEKKTSEVSKKLDSYLNIDNSEGDLSLG
jgi:septal ring factor EnvC (AmiA/AmiB activator)